MRFVKCIKGGFIMAKVRKICNTGSNKKIIIVKTVKKSKQKPKEGNQVWLRKFRNTNTKWKQIKAKRNTSRHKELGKRSTKKHYRTRCGCKKNCYCYI